VIIFEQVAALWQLVQPRGLREEAVMRSLRVRLLELPRLAEEGRMEQIVFVTRKEDTRMAIEAVSRKTSCGTPRQENRVSIRRRRSFGERWCERG